MFSQWLPSLYLQLAGKDEYINFIFSWSLKSLVSYHCCASGGSESVCSFHIIFSAFKNVVIGNSYHSNLFLVQLSSVSSQASIIIYEIAFQVILYFDGKFSWHEQLLP